MSGDIRQGLQIGGLDLQAGSGLKLVTGPGGYFLLRHEPLIDHRHLWHPSQTVCEHRC